MAGPISNADISELAKVWRPEVIDFLRTGDYSGIGVDERRILTRWKQNPSAVSRDLLIQFGKLDQIDSASVDAFLQEWYRGYNQREVSEEPAPEPPSPVATTIPGGAPGQVPVGSVPIDTSIEPGETTRPSLEQIAESQALAAYAGAAGVTGVAREPGRTPAPAAAPSEPGGFPSGVISDVGDTEADSNIPEDWRETAREMYPNYYAIVRNIPEIAALLERAVAQGYTPEKFQAELEQTNWFLQTSGAAREWEINSNRDPASAQRLIDEQRVSIRDMALATFGVRLSEERLTQLAVDSLKFKWSDRFLQNAIGDVATTSTAGITQLREGYIGQQLRKTANDYGIAVSDATFNQWVNKVAVGQESTASWEDYAKVQAKNLFPSIADRIDAGENFQQIVDPYRQSAAALLEIDGGDIDFTQPDWIKAITQMDDKGNQRQMSFTEGNDYVRQNRSFGYEYTEQAQRRAYQVANRLADLFGKV